MAELFLCTKAVVLEVADHCLLPHMSCIALWKLTSHFGFSVAFLLQMSPDARSKLQRGEVQIIGAKASSD